jgi:cupin domain
MWTRPDALEAPPHVHPRQGEVIRVTSGTARVRIGRNVRNMEAGEHVLIPAGTPRTFSNAGADELHVRHELTPALHWDDFCTRAWSLPSDARGRPNLLQMAMLLEHYPDHLYMADIPVPVQRAVVSMIATMARLAGKRLPT